ncbi:MAG: fibronectin type III domain-containing protein [Bradyrhizobium sp.]
MSVAAFCRTAILVSYAALVAGPALAQSHVALSGYNADISQSSISGISSGGFMAVQFGTAWSSVIKGVGIVAGGPFWCAQADANDAFDAFSLPFLNATGLCMSGKPLADLGHFIGKADAESASGGIDSLQGLSRQKIYVFHGYNDDKVAQSVTDATVAFYRHYLGGSNRGNLYYQTSIGAGHSFVVATNPHSGGPNECNVTAGPFIDACGYDQAGIILQHIYGPLNAPNRGQLNGSVKRFDQSIYTDPRDPSPLSLGDTGYVYVPKDCEDGAPCRVHIALHGCLQDAGEIDRRFINETGYNAWADTNRLIVLYPQTAVSWYLPYNPLACWDLWGYVDENDSYVTKSGSQIRTIKAMLDALTARATPVASPTPAPDVALTVVDTSDTSADLAWTPLTGAVTYRIWRAGADGQFAAVADTASPGFADSDLSPRSAYRWRITAVVNGVEGPPSAEAAATTRAAPPACPHPGNCPIDK